MKIVMIEPRISYKYFLHGYGFPRIGLPALGAILKKHGHQVKIFAEEVEKIKWEETLKADLVCFSILTATAPRSYKLARLIRKHGIPVIVGGPHPTFLPEESLENGADIVVRHEGEPIIDRLVTAIQNNENFSDIPGISFKKEGKLYHNPPASPNFDLDSFPYPDLDLVDGWRKKRIRITPIETSRGCPFRCNFCSVYRQYQGVLKFRNPEIVIREIKKQKNNCVFFVDDNFGISQEKTARLLQLMLKENATPQWYAQMMARTILTGGDEFVELMKRAGAKRLFIGFESINPETLESYQKAEVVEEIEECIWRLKKHKIQIHGMFVLGNDSDKKSTIWDTLRFCLKTKLGTIWFSIATPLPGSSLFHKLKNEGRITAKDWSLFDGLHATFRPMKIEGKILQEEVRKAMRRFYSLAEILKTVLRGEFQNFTARLYGWRFFHKLS